MNKEQYIEKTEEVVEVIKQSNFFKKFGYKHHWISGSSTLVYPISNWVESREIVIQLDSQNYRGRTQSAKSIISKIDKIMTIKYWGYGNYDGSCPPTLYIKFWE